MRGERRGKEKIEREGKKGEGKKDQWGKKGGRRVYQP